MNGSCLSARFSDTQRSLTAPTSIADERQPLTPQRVADGHNAYPQCEWKPHFVFSCLPECGARRVPALRLAVLAQGRPFDSLCSLRTGPHSPSDVCLPQAALDGPHERVEVDRFLKNARVIARVQSAGVAGDNDDGNGGGFHVGSDLQCTSRPPRRGSPISSNTMSGGSDSMCRSASIPSPTATTAYPASDNAVR